MDNEDKTMNMMMIGKPLLMAAVFGAAVVACGGSDGGNGSVGTGAQGTTLSVAERFVALNAKVDEELHVVARKYLNNDTEVFTLYEPVAGHIGWSAAGSPIGHSVLKRDQLVGKTASELWAYVAPGEAVPEALTQAIERSKSPAPVPDVAEPPAGPEGPGLASPPPATGETLLSGGFCSNGGFWNDFGTYGEGSLSWDHGIYNQGWHGYTYVNVTDDAGFGACPQGNVSNLGGWETVNALGKTFQWNLPPDYYHLNVWLSVKNCGSDCSCNSCNPFPFCSVCGTKCTPAPFNITGVYRSQCLINWGSSCGDNFDWDSWYSNQGSYCE
jgi:hypothetical protein